MDLSLMDRSFANWDYPSLLEDFEVIELDSKFFHFSKTISQDITAYFLHKDDLATIDNYNANEEFSDFCIDNYDILSWAMDVLDPLYQKEKDDYGNRKPHVLLTEKKHELSLTFVELSYLLRAMDDDSSLRIKKTKLRFTPAFKKLTFNTIADHPFFGLVSYGETPLFFVPKAILPDDFIDRSFNDLDSTNPLYDKLRKEFGQALIDHLEQIGLVYKREEENYQPTELLEVLFRAWNSWLALAASSRGKRLPPDFQKGIESFQKTLFDPNLFYYFMDQEILSKSCIKSISTTKEVSYTPLIIKTMNDSPQTSTKDENFALDYITKSLILEPQATIENSHESSKFENKPFLVLGEAGAGKTIFLKKLFSKSAEMFLRGEQCYIPVLLNLNSYKPKKWEKWLDNNLQGGQSIEFDVTIFPKYLEEGQCLLLLDGYDSLPPGYKEGFDEWLADQVEKSNKIVITNRGVLTQKADDYSISTHTHDKNYLPTIKAQVIMLLPLTQKRVINYIRNRKNLPKKQIMDLIAAIPNYLISNPLYLDLISSIDDDIPKDEISLFNKWVKQTELVPEKWLIDEEEHPTSDFFDQIIALIEKIAFHFSFPNKRESFTKDVVISVTDNDDPKIFSRMLKIGWIIPGGKNDGETYYKFAHDRIREFLAGKYIWNNWVKISSEIYSGENCLLNFFEGDKALEFAFIYGKNIINSPEINERLKEILDNLETVIIDPSLDSLRPFLVLCYLAGCLDLKNVDWFRDLKELVIFIWNNYFESFKWYNKVQSDEYFFKSLCKAMLAAKPDHPLIHFTLEKDDRRNKRKGDISLFEQWYKIITNSSNVYTPLLNQVINDFKANIKNKNDERSFLSLLSSLPLNPSWKDLVQEYVESPKTEFGSWLSAAKIYINYYPEELERLFSEWSSSPEPEIRKEAIKRCLHYHTEDNREFLIKIAKKELPKWLSSKSDDVKRFTLEKLYLLNSEKLDFDVDKEIAQSLNEKDYNIWLEVVNKRDRGYWFKEARKPLREWLYRKKSMVEIHKIFSYDTFLKLFDEIIPKYLDNITLKKAREIVKYFWRYSDEKLVNFLERLLTKFNNDEEIAKFLFYNKLKTIQIKDLDWVSSNLDEILDTADEKNEYRLKDSLIRLINEDVESVIPVLEKMCIEKRDTSAFVELVYNKQYENKEKLLSFVMDLDDWSFKAFLLEECYLLNPESFNLERKILLELMQDEHPVVRFFAINSLIYYRKQDEEINLLLEKAMEDQQSFVRAAAIRVAAMKDKLDLSRAINYFNWTFDRPSERTKNSWKNAYTRTRISYKLSEEGYNPPEQSYFGLAHPPMKRTNGYEEKDYEQDMSFLFKGEYPKIVIPKEGVVPSWIEKGLTDPESSIRLATLCYIYSLVTSQKDLTNLPEILFKVKSLLNDEDERIKAKAFFLFSLFTDFQFLEDFSENLEEKSKIEQRSLIFSVGIRKGLSPMKLLFELSKRESLNYLEHLILPFFICGYNGICRTVG
ncbi:MAG: NACHT domain-containing protein [Candidatus Heimdallarchaeota archaeon]|nr:NACHT domain-containing protein [Candidatus Heimdallarchaeota archaeon]